MRCYMTKQLQIIKEMLVYHGSPKITHEVKGKHNKYTFTIKLTGDDLEYDSSSRDVMLCGEVEEAFGAMYNSFESSSWDEGDTTMDCCITLPVIEAGIERILCYGNPTNLMPEGGIMRDGILAQKDGSFARFKDGEFIEYVTDEKIIKSIRDKT